MFQQHVHCICRVTTVVLLLTCFLSAEPVVDSVRTDTSSTVTFPQAASTLPAADRFESFSVLQKKYLARAVVSNLIYASGFGLYRGVVIPRARKATEMQQTLKLLPLSLLSAIMMYTSLPMSVTTTYKTRNNYRHYYKDAPPNISIPLLAGGIAIYVGSGILAYAQMYKDYRDNKDIDNSYTKFEKPIYGLVTAGGIIWAGTNLYSLAYVIALGKIAQNNRVLSTTQLTPLFIGDAPGAQISFEF